MAKTIVAVEARGNKGASEYFIFVNTCCPHPKATHGVQGAENTDGGLTLTHYLHGLARLLA